MRSAFPLLCVISSSLALPSSLSAQDTSLIEISLRDVNASLSDLHQSLRRINGRSPEYEVRRYWDNIVYDSQKVSSSLRYGADKVNRQSETIGTFDIPGTARILGLVNSVESETTTVVDDWLEIRPALPLGAKVTALNILRDHDKASQQYAQAILNKQNLLGNIAGLLYTPMTKSNIQRAIQPYEYDVNRGQQPQPRPPTNYAT